MEYIIIVKIEQEPNENALKSTEYGYTQDTNLADEINENYDHTLGAFIAFNLTKIEKNIVSVSEFFNETPFVYQANSTCDDIEGMDLIQINNISEL